MDNRPFHPHRWPVGLEWESFRERVGFCVLDAFFFSQSDALRAQITRVTYLLVCDGNKLPFLVYMQQE